MKRKERRERKKERKERKKVSKLVSKKRKKERRKRKKEGKERKKRKKVTTRGLFWDRPRNFEPLSDVEDDTSAGAPSPNFHATSTGGRLATSYYLTCSRPYTTDLSWNRVSGLEPSDLKPRPYH
ncbi:hypothetical protein AVEN_27853-1 [Araneus ventricosus]|uniref:Uncharacterized protein n=1 Tax=Araneus ventricosus TaxID=182803 RepID=A0A4Y2P852_ARAVE|nr:hypothetical protein AVEN_27853-1 [Araneus ventricosus]